EPENEVALQALEQLYRQAERWRELLEVYEKRRDLTLEPESRKVILYEIARLYQEQIQDPASAIETYAQVLEDDAADGTALEALDRLYLETKSWEAYAEVLRQRIELGADENLLVDLKFRLAETQIQHL